MIKNIVFDIGNVILEDTLSVVLDYFKINDNHKKIIDSVVFNNSKRIDMDLGLDNMNSYYEK